MVTRSEKLSGFLTEHVNSGEFPSAVYLAGEGDEIFFADALGNSVVEPYRIANKLDTIYDLASLTKPLVTGMLCARRIELGELTLDSSISHYLPEFERADKQMITVRELLTHTSGLPAWRPLYLLADDEPEGAAGAIANLDLEYKPGTRVIYSDLGFITLGILLERMTGQRLADLAQREIFEPLELKQTYFNPEHALQTGIAACETGNVYEMNMCEETGSGTYNNSRQRLIWGEVHDGNAYFMGGAAGHAGLFSTASEVFRIGQQFLTGYTKILRPETCELFRTNFTEGMNEDRSFAFQLASTEGSTAGLKMSPQSFGHNGFTGTSLWIDPVKDRIFVLLTNRTHDHPLPFVNINSVRREFHELAIELLDK